MMEEKVTIEGESMMDEKVTIEGESMMEETGNRSGAQCGTAL